MPFYYNGTVLENAQCYLNYINLIEEIVSFFRQRGISQIQISGDDIELLLFLENQAQF